jgi:hypothetical protein
MTDTTNVKLTITMSERRPIGILVAEWPAIALTERRDAAGGWEVIHVRAHRDGRRLVYGWTKNSAVSRHLEVAGGFLVPATPAAAPDEEGTVRAIRRMGGILGDPGMANACIAKLPTEELA